MKSCGEVVFTGENRRTRGKACPSATSPPQISHGLTQASAVTGRWLTAWSIALPSTC